MEIAIDIFAGLGLFFVGVKLIGNNLKELSSRWFRRLIEAATRNTTAAAAVGLLSGALTQSSSAITFISVSMLTAGLVEVSRVAPMVIWANVGTSVLVLLSAVDINIVVLFLLGVTGIAYYFDVDKAPRLRHLLGAVLGLGLLFLGLELIKSGSSPLKTMESVRDFLAFAASSYILGFLVGAVLAVVAQSSAMVSIIAVAMTNVGVLTIDQTFVIVIGASLGSGIGTAILAINLSGVGRQIAYLQLFVKLIGVAIVMPFFVAELYGLMPGPRALTSAIAPDPATEIAVLYLILQLLSAIIATLLQRPIMALAARLSPPTLAETLSRPRYIYAEAVDDPATALDLVEREQARLLERLPGIVDAVRDDKESNVAPHLLFDASLAVARQTDHFLTEILDRNSSRDALLAVIAMQKRNEILFSLIVAVNDYVKAVSAVGQRPADDKLGRLLFALGESLHTILTLAADAIGKRDAADLELATEFTSDRSTQMERVRRQVMAVDDITPAAHDVLYAATTLFERTLWLVRQYVRLVDGGPGEKVVAE